ncbi:FxSxx-COOH system tetratricopeptide repeat protein [Actinomadura yumaensis]|uniref:FxSxx-COOH system tetratricopeptide repeat protein n=1 Tax=Actinomadura yumaensis TaxID=111807 RepID=UPI00361A678E
MIDKLVEALRGLDPPPTAEELADTLWLARRLRYEPAAEPAPGRETDVPADAPGPAPAPDVPGASAAPGAPGPGGGTAGPGAPSAAQAGLYLPGSGTAGPSFHVRAPALPAIPDALGLARALRPLRLTVPSPHRMELDEAATARSVAETGIWQPVTRPCPERRLDLALVVDTAPSMVVWRRTAAELRTLVERLGAFRRVRVWYLDTDGDLLPRTGRAAGDRVDRVVPAHRRVVLVVSDCVGAAWQDGRAAALLERWGRVGPVAVAQPLPQRLWRRCGAAVEPVLFTASAPAIPNARLVTRPREDAPDGASGFGGGSGFGGASGASGADGAEFAPGVAVPVMELDPRWMRTWAAMVANGGRDVAGSALFTGRPVDEDAHLDGPTDELSPLERVKRFRAASSPMAFDLAGYLAAAPLRLPVMRLVQQAMLPESTPAHLAEVFLGDLMRIAGPGPGGSRDPYEVAYEFRDGVRDVLLGRLLRGEALRVLREVWTIVRGRLGSSLDFPALLGAIQSDDDYLPPDRPFAHVAAQVLVRLGGRYSEVARRIMEKHGELEGTARGAVPAGPAAAAGTGGAGGLGTAESSLWGNVPPRNPYFTGRAAHLAAVRDALRNGPAALIPGPGAEPGGSEGKTQIAAEYAHRHAGEYDAVWWVPAGDPVSARAALAELARRLGTPLSDDVRVTAATALAALASGRPYARCLLVYDSAGGPDETAPLLPPPRPGSRCDVLVTSRDRAWADASSGVGVGPFERAESTELLRLRAPALAASDAARVADRLGDAPPAVDQAGVWLGSAGGGAAEYLRLLDLRTRDLAARSAGANEPGGARDGTADAAPPTLLAAYGLVFDRLQRERPLPARLLELWAHLGPEPVPGRLLAAGSAARSAAGGAAGLPADLAGLMADARLRSAAMRDIDRFGLGRFDPGTGGLQVHPAVRAMLLDGPAGAAARPRGTVHAMLAAATPERWPDDEATWPARAEITPHVVPSGIVAADRADARAVVLDQARFLRLAGDFEGARLLADLAVERWREAFGEDDAAVLDATRALADALRELGDVKSAVSLGEDVLARMRRSFGEDHLGALPAAHGFGADLRLRGDFRRAYEVDVDLWRRARQRFGSDHPATLLAANGVGADMRLLGKFHDAYEVDHDAFQELRGRPGRGYLELFRATNHLARDLHCLGRYGEALERQRAALDAPHPALGPDHALVLEARTSHAGTLRKAGEHGEAERLAAETLRAHVRRFGEQHPNTLAAKVSLAMARASAGTRGAAGRCWRRPSRSTGARSAPTTRSCTPRPSTSASSSAPRATRRPRWRPTRPP